MKVFSKLLFVLLSFSLLSSCTKKDDPEITDAKTVNSINGRIIDSETGQGVLGATVSIAGAEASDVVTDPKGYYRFDKVKSGQQYSINVTHGDYYSGTSNVTLNFGDAKANDISLIPNKCFSIFGDYDFGTDKTEISRVLTSKVGKDIQYTLSKSSSWIVLDKTSGYISKNGNGIVNIKVDRSKMASSGAYEGTVTINHDCGGKALILYITASKP